MPRFLAPKFRSRAVLLVACCGMLATAPVQADPDMPTFTVVARDGRLAPDRIEVPANARFKLTLKNEGRTPVEIENLDLRVEKVLAPGASSFVVIRSLKPGSYPFVDEFHENTGRLLLIAK